MTEVIVSDIHYSIGNVGYSIGNVEKGLQYYEIQLDP